MNDYLIKYIVAFSVIASIFYFVNVNAYSGIYLGAVIFALCCVIVIFFNDNDQIIKNY